MSTRYQGFAIISTLVLIVTVTILLSLGFWQLGRMQEKQDILADLEAVEKSAPVPLESLSDNTEKAGYQTVSVKSRMISDTVWLLDNQPFEGQMGYKVLVVGQTNAGNVLMDLGWIPAPLSRNEFPLLPQIEAMIDGVGRVSTPSDNPFVDNTYVETRQVNELSVSRIQAIDMGQIAQQVGLTIQPFLLTLTAPHSDYERPFRAINMGPEKHLAYAIQWFSLAAAALIIGIVVMRKRKASNE